MKTRHVISAFLQLDGHILLVKRSSKVGSYQGYWSAISGYVENETALLQAQTEIEEETGLTLDKYSLVNEGDILEIDDARLQIRWIVHPFLFVLNGEHTIRLDWENCEMAWVEKGDLNKYKTVPALEEALKSASKL